MAPPPARPHLGVARLITRACMFNVLAFGIGAMVLGGDAVVGSPEGRYFLSDHGTLTEVGRRTWVYSRTHSWLIWVSIPALLGALLAGRRRKADPPDRLLMPVLVGGTAILLVGEGLKPQPGPASAAVVAWSVLAGAVAAAAVVLYARRRASQP